MDASCRCAGGGPTIDSSISRSFTICPVAAEPNAIFQPGATKARIWRTIPFHSVASTPIRPHPAGKLNSNPAPLEAFFTPLVCRSLDFERNLLFVFNHLCDLPPDTAGTAAIF